MYAASPKGESEALDEVPGPFRLPCLTELRRSPSASLSPYGLAPYTGALVAGKLAL